MSGDYEKQLFFFRSPSFQTNSCMWISHHCPFNIHHLLLFMIGYIDWSSLALHHCLLLTQLLSMSLYHHHGDRNHHDDSDFLKCVVCCCCYELLFALQMNIREVIWLVVYQLANILLIKWLIYGYYMVNDC